MPLFDSFGRPRRVHVLKKIKVNGQWKLCPAVIEPNGNLKHRVRVDDTRKTARRHALETEYRSSDGARVLR